MRCVSTVGLALTLVACGPADPDPDVSYEVTVTGETNGCTDSTQGYRETFVYDLFFDVASVLIEVDDVALATGEIRGCEIEYSTSIWLEENDDGTYMRWQIDGEATYQGAAGGCLSGDNDWEGTETITVLESTDPAVAADCTYTMSTAGTLVQQ